MRHGADGGAPKRGAKLNDAPLPRAVHTASTQLPHTGANAQCSRSNESLRAERAYNHWTGLPLSQRPLEIAARSVADAFDRAMMAEGLSNAALAEHCAVDEKTVRQWRANEKKLPVSALIAMPEPLVERLLAALIPGRQA
jgi:hypothetical protein